MVHYTGVVPVFHIQINWNFISMAIAILAAIHRPLFKLQSSHICRCVTDPNNMYLCSNMFYC